MQDKLFEQVAAAIKDATQEESEEEFDLAAMMALQRQQAASLHKQASQLRASAAHATAAAPLPACALRSLQR